VYRLAYEELLSWKNNESRKPLIVEGPRQCGKTFLLEEFGKKNYKNVVYLNFEGNDELVKIFEPNLNTSRIITQLAILSEKKIDPGDTLIIFDEIQFCSKALTSLKYFCEEAPEYHVACAGSLLGVLMSKPYSFPVGKVDRITMGPMNFKEYLLASGEAELVKAIDERCPMDEFLHPFASKLEFHLRIYLTIGGMPAAVSSWTKKKDINEVNRIIDNIMVDYENDFAKHATESVQKLTLIWDSVPEQLAKENNKFMFGHVRGGARARDLEDALEWLINAGLVFKVKRANPSRQPLQLFADNTSFKLYLADVGILRRMSGLRSFFEFETNEEFGQFKGAIMENYVLTELISMNKESPFYWRSKANAEVDFIIQCGMEVVPIEVKSGHKTLARSMAEYIKEFKPRIAVIASLEMKDEGVVKKVPLYGLWRLPSVIEGAERKQTNE